MTGLGGDILEGDGDRVERDRILSILQQANDADQLIFESPLHDAGFGVELTTERKGNRDGTGWLNEGHYRDEPRLSIRIIVELDPDRCPAAAAYIEEREDITRARQIREADLAIAAAERAAVDAAEAIETARARRAALEGTTP